MASKSAPYATSNDQPTPPRSSRSKAGSSLAPWEKDQSPKMQSKGGDSRKTQLNGGTPRTTATAPYGTTDNLQSSPSPKKSEQASITQSAPFGTEENVPVQRADRHQMGRLTAFGTTVEKKPTPKAVAPDKSAPWDRDESKYTHRGKNAASHGFVAPYATQE